MGASTGRLEMRKNGSIAIRELKLKLQAVERRLENGERMLHKASDNYVELRRLKAEYESAINALLEQQRRP